MDGYVTLLVISVCFLVQHQQFCLVGNGFDTWITCLKATWVHLQQFKKRTNQLNVIVFYLNLSSQKGCNYRFAFTLESLRMAFGSEIYYGLEPLNP